MSTLDLAMIGNGRIAALVDKQASVVWCCFPRFDGDPAFCSLLQGERGTGADDFGYFAIDVVDAVRFEQEYVRNTAVLVTRIHDKNGGAVEITDFAPRYRQFDRIFAPMMLVRQ